MSEIVYAVHTRACTYLLDEEGICRWVLSRSGARSDDRCVGAQFVAALDLSTRGGLVGELRIGASALFIRHDGERYMLIRTKPIEHVEIRGAGDEAPSFDELPTETDPEPDLLPAHHAVAAVFNAPVLAPEPPPPPARVMLRGASYPEPPPRMIPTQPFPREPPTAPPRYSEPPSPPPRGHTEPPPPPRGHTEPPPPPAPPRMFPRPPPREARFENPPTETQPLPPAGRMPAWPPMLAPPPPPAEMLPLGPARMSLPSAEELDVSDLEEVNEDEQVYSMEVTLSLPLFRPDPHASAAWRR